MNERLSTPSIALPNIPSSSLQFEQWCKRGVSTKICQNYPNRWLPWDHTYNFCYVSWGEVFPKFAIEVLKVGTHRLFLSILMSHYCLEGRYAAPSTLLTLGIILVVRLDRNLSHLTSNCKSLKLLVEVLERKFVCKTYESSKQYSL